ncbi:MAG: endonuclease/exonuclease/phosphatase family protein [Marinifilum sp.]|jgi:endonuclease/exonuclease/phosphatase family metal-dependent hydrolase|nr:endonuclease/exonuclease/phosphatase family protein [Marinifilum sp.]
MKKIILVAFCLSICIFYACDQKQSSQLKIISYNIKHGEGMDQILDLSRSAEIIKAQAPNLCGLQEIDDFCLRSDSVGQTDYLAQKTNMAGTFGKFMNLEGGEYGMATLVANPLVSTKLLQLPDGIYEPRSSIIHEVEVTKACTIIFVNVHFDWIESNEGESSRLNQAKALIQYLDTIDKAIIICGDFNCTPTSPTMQYFNERGFELMNKGEDNLSFQGPGKAELDHVIYRSNSKVKIKGKNIMLLHEPVVSDHRPLVANVELIY